MATLLWFLLCKCTESMARNILISTKQRKLPLSFWLRFGFSPQNQKLEWILLSSPWLPTFRLTAAEFCEKRLDVQLEFPLEGSAWELKYWLALFTVFKMLPYFEHFLVTLFLYLLLKRSVEIVFYCTPVFRLKWPTSYLFYSNSTLIRLWGYSTLNHLLSCRIRRMRNLSVWLS